MKKVALITGGSRGIGLGIAHKMAEAGFDLAINGMRTETDVQEVLENLKKLGRDVIYCQGDISKKEANLIILINLDGFVDLYYFSRFDLQILMNRAFPSNPYILKNEQILLNTCESFCFYLFLYFCYR